MIELTFFLKLSTEEIKQLCGGTVVLKTIRFVWKLLDVVFFVTPILLIILISIDFIKNVMAKNENEMSKNLSIAIKRIILASCLFLVPTFVSTVNSLVGSLGIDYTICVKIAKGKEDLSIYELKVDYDSLGSKEIDLFPGNKQIVTKDNDTSSNSSNNSTYPDDVIENLAAFIGSEAGAYKEGFEAQLITGAIFLNNMFSTCGKDVYITSADQITKATMCEIFKYGRMYLPAYCDYTFDTINANETQRKQLTVAAKLVLSGKFSIPGYIQGQGKEENWAGTNFKVWGHLSTTPNECVMDSKGEDGCSQVYAYFPICYNGGELPNKDVFGKTVSTNFDDYKEIADKLYNTYLK